MRSRKPLAGRWRTGHMPPQTSTSARARATRSSTSCPAPRSTRRSDFTNTSRRSAEASRSITLMTDITIGSRKIGQGQPCFVIAEAGINHNGDLVLATELLDAAASAGADAFEIQTHLPEHEMLKGGATAAYVGESLFDLLTRTALPADAHKALQERAKKKGIIFLSTPFSREAADFLES